MAGKRAEEQLRALAVVARAVFEELGAGARYSGFVQFELDSEPLTVAIQITPDGTAVVDTTTPRGDALLVLRGSQQGLLSLFNGTFDSAVRDGDVKFDGRRDFVEYLLTDHSQSWLEVQRR